MPKSKHRSKKQNKPKPIKWKSDEGLFRVPANPRPTIEFPRPETNSRMDFTGVPEYPKNNPLSFVPRSPLGGNSIYEVNFIFSIPGVDTFRESVDFETFPNTGKSLLHLPFGEQLIVKIEHETESVDIMFRSNKDNLLSDALLRVQCDSFEVAQRFAHERISMILSHWSFLFDVAIDIAGYKIKEEATQTVKFSLGFVGKVKVFTDDTGFESHTEYRRLFAAYREALNSSNIFYKALSFFKVAEGILVLRKREGRKNKTLVKGVEPFEPQEKFPASLDLLPVQDELTHDAFEPYLNKDFSEALNNLREFIRNAIAHLGDFESVLDADRFDDIKTCNGAIPVLKYIARSMLENNLNKLTSKT